MSSTAAHVMVTVPTRVFSRSRSTRMRASTGNAVIDMATPMKSANDVKETPAGACASKRCAASKTPSAKGAMMLA